MSANIPEFSVTEISFALKRSIEENFAHVRVRGEIGRVSRPGSGHIYLDLKDDKSVLSACVWKAQVRALRIQPEQGLEVIATGRITTFPGQSKYQLIIEHLEPAGAGALMALLEARRKQLAAEGLFDAARKKPLPFLPAVIGVVTSPSGAVIRDILHRLADRFPRHVLVWPVLVQGERAAGEVAAAIAGFNRLAPGGRVPRPDLLIVARGGGSIEDLWAFNEEIVVRAAAASAIPLISAVGHETDTTLIDFAADFRAPTPTAAAERAVPVRAELAAQLQDRGARLTHAETRLFTQARMRLEGLARGLPRPLDILAFAGQRLDALSERLLAGLREGVRRRELRLATLKAHLRPSTLQRELERQIMRLGELENRLAAALRRHVAEDARKLAAAGKLLETVSYEGVLERGFALVHHEKGGIARRKAALSPGDGVFLEFHDGKVEAVIGGKTVRRRSVQGELF